MMLFLFKSAIVLSVLLMFYKLFLQKESFFTLNRYYLLLGLLLTFSLPFLTLPELMDHQGIVDKVLSAPKQTMLIDLPSQQNEEIHSPAADSEIDGTTDNNALQITRNKRGVWYWIGLLYGFGFIVLSLNFLTQLLGIFMRIRKSKDRLVDGNARILNQSEETEPCSFFKYIFINPDAYDWNTYEQIIEHEKIHVQKRHSLDLLLAEVAIIILWFNPLAWLYRREVEKNIEYQTDAILLESNKVASETYQMNLLNIASLKKTNALVSNYNQSLIKKRIIMMNKQKSNSNSYWKYAFVAPLLFAILLVLNQPSVLQAQEPKEEVYRDAEEDNNYEKEYDDDLNPLLRAVRHGDYTAVERMLKNGADVNLMQRGEGTPLTMAIRSEHFNIAELLMEKGADANLGTDADGYPLWMAARKGNVKLVRLLIRQGANVNTKFPGDGSALIQAAKTGNLEMVNVLVDLGADVNMSVEGDGNPLIMASKRGSLDVVKFLMNKGAKVNTEVPGDETPLINASEQGHLDVVKFLVAQGADVNKVCKEELRDGSIRVRTALQMAKRKGHEAVVDYLVKKGAID
ncbi:ankyrin repeat domain-containing protein [Maribacter sp. 2307UL18-2]|uniref:ankyrin repeat domain-containing protein n=1 Tax=Maribacter sp. 2307UL18-2 TaxID=3386274 RepID=UPI0039BC450F